jgi:putative ABC transport system permease protein
MLNHLFKLIWNRKRSNLLIITEVVITFLVLFAVISMARHFYQTYQQPLGFNWQNTWSIHVDTGGQWNNETDKGPLKRLVEVLRQQPEIASVGLTSGPMFRDYHWTSSETFNDKTIRYEAFRVNGTGPKDWGVELVGGRWFSKQDDGQNYEAIMVNKLFADTIFPGVDAVNQEIPDADNPENNPKRIVGVYNDFRKQGEFSSSVPFMMYRYQMDAGYKRGMGYLHIKYHQKQPAAFEENLLKLLKGVTPKWAFNINTWKSQRETMNKKVLLPIVVLCVLAVFLLIMVAMGLFGILWQNINQRTAEIGLRRAVGASAASIMWQIVGEIVTLAMFAMAVASVIVLQVPLLELVETVTWPNFFFSLFSAMGVILLTVVLCALYPARIAIKMEPALALHYE